VREKEPHEKYFEGIAGSEEKAKPFLESYSEIKTKKKETKMEDLLRTLLKAVENVEFSDDAKEENILRRLLHENDI
jgi:hypothetical protein